MYKEIDEMLRDDVIEPFSADWSSPIIMIRKLDGIYRVCLDFRRVNSETKKDAYPLPQINSILDKLRKAKFISKINLHKGFLQIPLHPDSRAKTAFTVSGRGLFQFKRMPFGLTNAPATFQRLLDKLISSDMESNVFVYLDDIIIVMETSDDHLEWLKKVLDKIKSANLKLSPDKCEFCCTQVQIDPEKVEYDYPLRWVISRFECNWSLKLLNLSNKK